MDLTTFNWLLSPDGAALIAVAQRADLHPGARLRELERLRHLAGPERAAAAYETVLLRERAAKKFSHANAMFFTREALEQSTGELIATYRAARFTAAATIADLTCGIGGDTFALARIAPVIAIDSDPLRLAMAEANACALGIADRIRFVCTDISRTDLPSAHALFVDPARRRDGRRVTRFAEYEPPPNLIPQWRRQVPAIAVKLAPGIDDADVAPLGPAEREFISQHGELKEAVLWFAPLGTSGHRATRVERDGIHTMYHPDPTALPALRLGEPTGYLIEPDPAVIRARLVALLATQIDAVQLDPSIAYLIGSKPAANPFARSWRIIEWMPFALRKLRARLLAYNAGPVTVKKRGSALDTDTLARQLSGDGPRPLVVVLTLAAGRPIVLICEDGPVERDINADRTTL